MDEKNADIDLHEEAAASTKVSQYFHLRTKKSRSTTKHIKFVYLLSFCVIRYYLPYLSLETVPTKLRQKNVLKIKAP